MKDAKIIDVKGLEHGEREELIFPKHPKTQEWAKVEDYPVI